MHAHCNIEVGKIKNESARRKMSEIKKYCEPCLYIEEKEEATGFCLTCAEYLCRVCVKEHRKAKLTRNHSLTQDSIPGNADVLKELRDLTICKRHTEMKITHYCPVHDDYMCAVCCVEKHKQCQQIIDLINTEEMNANDSEINQQLEKLNVLVKDCLAKSKKAKDCLQEDKTLILEEKNQELEKAILRLRDLDKDSTEKLDQLFPSASSDIQCRIVDIELIQASYAKHMQTLEAALKSGDRRVAKVVSRILLGKITSIFNTLKEQESCEHSRLQYIKTLNVSELSAVGHISVVRNSQFEKLNGVKTKQSENTASIVTDLESNLVKTVCELEQSLEESCASEEQRIDGTRLCKDIIKPLKTEKCVSLSKDETGPETPLENVTEKSCDSVVSDDITNENGKETNTHFSVGQRLQAQPDLYNIRVRSDRRPCYIDGMVVTDKYVVLIDRNNTNLKVLSHTYPVLSTLSLPGKPMRICQTGENMFVVSFLNVKRINTYTVVDDTRAVYIDGFETALYNSGLAFDGQHLFALMSDADMLTQNSSKSHIIEFQLLNPRNGNIVLRTRNFKVFGAKTWSLNLRNTQTILLTNKKDLLIAERNRILCFNLEMHGGQMVAKETRFYVCRGDIPRDDIYNIAADDNFVYASTDCGKVLRLSLKDYNDFEVIIEEHEDMISIQVDKIRKRLLVACAEENDIRVFKYQ